RAESGLCAAINVTSPPPAILSRNTFATAKSPPPPQSRAVVPADRASGIRKRFGAGVSLVTFRPLSLPWILAFAAMTQKGQAEVQSAPPVAQLDNLITLAIRERGGDDGSGGRERGSRRGAAPLPAAIGCLCRGVRSRRRPPDPLAPSVFRHGHRALLRPDERTAA